jgi:hypothetical protein
MLGHDSLHKGKNYEMETIIDLLARNSKWPSGAWLEKV